MIRIVKIFIIISLVGFSSMTFAQIDTLSYLKTFEANKSKYIGKPLSTLLADMTKMQPKTIWPIPNFKKKSVLKGSTLKFCGKSYSFGGNVIHFDIIWQDNILYSQADYYQQKNKFYFTAEEKAYYSSKIISDIIVR